MLDSLATARAGRSRRFSSWDTSGRNRDAWHLAPGETKTLATLGGAGVIRHLWFTWSQQNDPLSLKNLVLRAFWDGAEFPSVEAPLGDFFGMGHARPQSFANAVMNCSAHGSPVSAAFNCWWPMPFARGARLTIEQQGGEAVEWFYFYVDYDELPSLPEDQLRFHAWWNRENPCRPAPLTAPESGPGEQANLSDAENYLLLETEGRGHYAGCCLSVHNLCGGWWGEGDDMMMVDGAKWPPDLHGTGSEDYFGHAWGMQPGNAFPYNGVSYHQPGGPHAFNERITVYRLHLADPVVFQERLRVSIEHGHANDRADDCSSVAYWYQLPLRPLPPLPPASERAPRPDATLAPRDLPVVPTIRPSGAPYELDA